MGGSISINGQLRDMNKFKNMSCYIMQENFTQPNLTVLETMSFAADLKIGRRKSKSQKRAIIDEILSTLRLTGTLHTITDQLSGGEKKRLIIALELINNPPVIFLDEPTTGLDHVASMQCINVLKRLARFGRTVVCSVHTPSANAFQKFDHVYVITNGQCIYRDSASNVVPFLRNVGIECPIHYDPADFIIELSAGDYGFDVVERMVTYVNTKLPLSIFQSKSQFDIDKEKVAWIDQFSTLMKRMIVQLYRNRSYIYLKISLHLFLGIIVGNLYFNMGNDGSKAIFNFGFCFACVIFFMYMPLMPVLLQFPLEVQLMKREHFNRWYHLSAYFWAFTVVNIPLQIIFAVFWLSMVYFITGQPLELHRSAKFFGTCFVCAFIAESIGHNIASVFNVMNSLFIGPVLCCPLLLFATQDFGDPNPQPLIRTILIYSSYIRYGLECLLMAMYDYDRPRLPCPKEEIYCHFSSPKEIMKAIGANSQPNFWLDIFALFIILFILKGLSYYLLRQKVQPNKAFQTLYKIGKMLNNHFNM
ncbi:ATP-binding cassette sub-family G member 1 isoform X2 [Monomorium pharaonis]|nr:ATP-binding cassette sub-family G member 1 isoform X2 [Monomorium pharaonis]